MLSFFKKPQVVDSNTAEQLQHTFEWLLTHFDQQYFEQETILVHPTREYFPDRTDNELDMAKALCARIQGYTGLTHWPFKLLSPQQFTGQMPPLLSLAPNNRAQKLAEHTVTTKLGAGQVSFGTTPILEISYTSAMIKKPMDLVGSMSKNFAQHYLYQSQLTPPTGPESFDAASEILAIFMGFGIIIANSAYTFRGSCARCYDPRANRSAALSEDEALFCLALFCHHKNIKNGAVMPSLKNYLRSRFKKARQQIAQN